MKINYRPEIDGLRAIAVLSVIFYHARLNIFDYNFFNGGYFGVDIFFVISGYLITSIIYKELYFKKSFSFFAFYQRRIRRILPALLCVFIVTIPFAWIYILPNRFIEYSESILYALGFSSNFYFYYSGLEYASENALLKPFLHTWSLSIEEQFYIIFPIILYFSFKYLHKYTFIILVILFIISFLLSYYGSINFASLNFYLLPTRAWELLAGSLLAYIEINSGHRSKNKLLNIIFPFFGLFLIIFSVYYFDDKIINPSFYTLVPVIGVMLIIWFSNSNDITTKILSFKPLVGIGLISYSLYLIHYPVFAFARINLGKSPMWKDTVLTHYDKIELIFLIIILSTISYLFVERPFRNKNFRFKYVFLITSITIILILFFNLSNIYNKGYQNRLPEVIADSMNVTPTFEMLLDDKSKKCINNTCFFNTQREKKIVLFGDSHAGSLSFGLKEYFDNSEYQFVTKFNNCFNFRGIDQIHRRTKRIHPNCNIEKSNIDKIFFDKTFDSTIIIVGRFPAFLSNMGFNNLEGGVERDWDGDIKLRYPFKKSEIIDSFNNFVESLLKNNNKIILVYPIPEVGFEPAKEILKMYIDNPNKYLNGGFNYMHNTSYDVYKKRTKKTFELFDNIKSDNISRVYPHKLFCDNFVKGRCITHDDNNIFYCDNDHPSLAGAEKINNLILDKINNLKE